MNALAKTARAEFENELARLGEALSKRALLESGQPVDLSGLDERINDFCTRLMASDDATKQDILPQLSGMLVQLEELEALLRRMQEAYERTRAASAYGKKDEER